MKPNINKPNMATVLVTAFFGLTSMFALTAPSASAAVLKFAADKPQIRHICRRHAMKFWQQKHHYGCGNAIKCAGGSCKQVVRYPPTFPPPKPGPRDDRRTFGLGADIGGGEGAGGGGGGRR